MEQQQRGLTQRAQTAEELEGNLRDHQRRNSLSAQELERAKAEHRFLLEKQQNLEKNYDGLFENYTKMEVHCEGLQKELSITKGYLSNVQIQLSQSKEAVYALQEERGVFFEDRKKMEI